MSSRPRFTVVIATYNRAHYIVDTLNSVFAQSCKDFEIVVVDDGSTDDTTDVLAPFAGRIRLFRQPNRGVSAAWNHGIRESRGSFVAFLASDDMWEPETLQEMGAVFGAHPEVGLVSVMARVIRPDGRRTERTQGKRSAGSTYTPADLLRGGWCSWFAVRRELLEQVGGYDERLRTAEECELCLRLWFRTKFHAIRRPLLLRRLHESNLTVDQRANARNWLYILDKLEREHPDFVRRNAGVFRRARGKEHLRLGRELLAAYSGEPVELEKLRLHLRASIANHPRFVRAYAYLLWSLLAPRAFGSWRRAEIRRLR